MRTCPVRIARLDLFRLDGTIRGLSSREQITVRYRTGQTDQNPLETMDIFAGSKSANARSDGIHKLMLQCRQRPTKVTLLCIVIKPVSLERGQ
jgi:hypothetical protein